MNKQSYCKKDGSREEVRARGNKKIRAIHYTKNEVFH